MKTHLKLDLDALQVETFDPAGGPEPRQGTVHAFITGICDETQGICSGNQSCLALCTAYCPAQQSLPCTILALTCQPTAQTCATACNSGCQSCASCVETCQLSCDYFDCNPTCEFQTQCW